jgi:type I restriction enzyme S subunit
MEGQCRGGTRDRVSRSFLARVRTSLPPLAEQRAIAAFLDRETKKIDELVAEQERLIELLKEKRQAVISHAVTKGLDPAAPMRDSGVEWLGEVPAQWEVRKFTHAISVQEVPGIMALDFVDDGVPLLRVAGAQGRWATLKGCNYLDPEKVAKRWKHFRLDEGDLVISGSASTGTVCEVGPEARGAVPYTGLMRLVPIPGLTEKHFVRALVSSGMFFTQIDLLKAGATIQHFGPTHLARMVVTLPPVEQQQQIAEFVDFTSDRYAGLVREAEAGIELLLERRSALISAAVTGKIDVRGLVPEEADAE